MSDLGNPDPEGWLRATPVAKIRLTCNGVPLSGTYDETTGRFVLDDPDLALRPVELRLSVDSEEPSSQADADTLADVLTDVHTESQDSLGTEWISISPYGTCIQLCMNGEPMAISENIPNDGVVLEDTTAPDSTEIRLESKNLTLGPSASDHSVERD